MVKQINREILDIALKAVRDEVLRSTAKHRLFSSTHEAYGVMMEEIEEWWYEIKADNLARAKSEAVHVAAMAVKFMLLKKLQ